MIKYGLGKSGEEEGTPEWKSGESSGQLEEPPEVWNLEELCVFPQVEIPAGFKIPDFVKYDGTTNPEFHLKAYCLTMGRWGRDEKLFLAHFHFSLTGFAFQWYIRLGKESLRSWQDMAQAFLKQFKHNKLELTRESMQSLSRKVGESFREYAQRWKQIAMDVQPPMTDQEERWYFLKTLKDPHYGLMLVTPFKDFSQLITMGEDIDFKTQEEHISPLIEAQLNKVQGKEDPDDLTPFTNRLDQPMPITPNTSAFHVSTKTLPFSSVIPYQKAIEPFNLCIPTILSNCFPSLSTPCITTHLSEPRSYTPNRIVVQAEGTQQVGGLHTEALTNQRPNCNKKRKRRARNPISRKPFPDSGISQLELFKQLSDQGIITPRLMTPLMPPYPRWYKPELSCEYHANAPGHSIETCGVFQTKVQVLRKNNMIQEGNAREVIQTPELEGRCAKKVKGEVLN